MRIELHLKRNAGTRPDKPAVIDGNRHLTYRDLAEQSRSLAGGMALLGIRRGDRVLFLLDNSLEAVVAFFAVWRIGAVACPLHPTVKCRKLADILQNTDATAIIHHARLHDIVQKACSTIRLNPALVVVNAESNSNGEAISFENLLLTPASDEGPDNLEADHLDAGELALLIHTSGSTGTPKGVMLTHANLDFACTSIRNYLHNDENDVVLSALPLSFGYGITQMVTMAMTGGTLVLERSFAFPLAILTRAADLRVTGIPLVPAMAGMIASITDLQPGFLPHLRYVTSAAAAMPPATTQALRRLFPRADLFLMYGQTECIRTSYLPPRDIDRKPTCVGQPLSGTDVDIVGDDGRSVEVGEIGELYVAGPHVMAGYWRDEAATARAIINRDGKRWLRTGDLFRRDSEGSLHFVARQDDIIKTRGEKVSPQEVERVLYALPGVVEAAVEGVADPIFGQVIKAHVVLAPGAEITARAVQRHCAEHLEDFMIPKLVEFRDTLPKTASGKIRLSLAQTMADDAEGKVA